MSDFYHWCTTPWFHYLPEEIMIPHTATVISCFLLSFDGKERIRLCLEKSNLLGGNRIV